ncbi:MAG: hypothetical protein IT381_20135 [Deltaproteobacteria bacterium]|nr:hypothetical protein [Deltaproteobacteria bacterium]
MTAIPIFVVLLQLSGLAPLVETVFHESCAASDSDCPDEQSGNHCQPGCTSCHCPQSALRTLLAPRAGVNVAPALQEELSPPPPAFGNLAAVRGIYRPPRA